MSTAKIGNLEARIEELVREHVAAMHRAAAAALDRGFDRALQQRGRSGRDPRVARGEPGRRRAEEELAALSERLYAAICAHPGSAMSALASQLGLSPRELNRPAVRLRQGGRVRSVGQRHATRYFPLSAKTPARA